MTFLPAIELVSKVPPPKVGRSRRRSSGLVSVPAAVVGRWVEVGAAVVEVVEVAGGRVVGAAVVADDGGAVVAPAVVALDGTTVEAVLTVWSAVEEVVDESSAGAAVAPSPSTVTTRAAAGWVATDGLCGAAATTLDVGAVDARVSTAAESGWVQEVMASPIASTAKGGLERIRTL